jgi:glycosyltransferase involved in cell wall biosynthesis
MLSLKNNVKIVATILAKNEEDIIGRTIEHHISQGVSQFIITDNASEDRTRSIIEKYPEVVELIDEREDDHNQSKWVTRMARMACKLKPDWIVHLDADELWCGLSNLRDVKSNCIGSTKMLLHPPSLGDMRHYLDFSNIPSFEEECKVAHRPNETIQITHGNHGFHGISNIEFTKNIWRHHYPIRSYAQFVKKSLGHESLMKRNSICERWKNWYDLHKQGKLEELYHLICKHWQSMIVSPNKEDLIKLLEFWSPQEVIDFFNKNNVLPEIGEWPKEL